MENLRVKSIRLLNDSLPGLGQECREVTPGPFTSKLLAPGNYYDGEGMSEKEIEEMSGAIVKIMNDNLMKELAKVREELDAKWAEGVSPADVKVKELEDKLTEKETEVDALIKTHLDDIRVLKSEMNQLGHGYTRPEGGPIDPMRVDFKGCFMSQDRMRAIVDEHAGGDTATRAIDVGTSLATSGKLPTEVADRFIDLIIQEQQLLSRITTRRMLSPEARLDEMLVASRRIRLVNENFEVTGAFTDTVNDGSPGVADGVTFVARTLTTVEIVWAFDITLNFLEDNIERANGEAHVASAIARQFGTDLNDLAVNGDEGVTVADSDTAFQFSKDGFIALIEDAAVTNENTYDPTGNTAATQVMRGMHKAIPQKYKARTDYGYFVPTGFAELYADEVQQRETSFGDSVLLDGFPALRYFGRPVWPEPALANTAANAAKALLFPTQTAFHGIGRNIRVDSEFKPRPRRVEYTITARIGYQLIGPQTWVRLSANIPATLL